MEWWSWMKLNDCYLPNQHTHTHSPTHWRPCICVCFKLVCGNDLCPHLEALETQSHLQRETFGSLFWPSRRSQSALQSLRWYRIKNSFHLPQPDFWPDWEQRGSLPLMLDARPGAEDLTSAWPRPWPRSTRAAWHVGGAEKPCLKQPRRARPPCAVFKEKLCLRVCQSQLICSCADIHPIKLSTEFTSQRQHLFTSDCPGLTWPTVSEENKLHCRQKAAICRVVTIKVRAEGCVWAKSTFVCQGWKALGRYVP